MLSRILFGLAPLLCFFCPQPSYAQSLSVLNFGDSRTLQSAQYLSDALGPRFDVHSVVENGRHTKRGVLRIASWLTDPDNDPATVHPETWDIVRFNHGIWDAIPIDSAAGVTTTNEYITNLNQIVGAIRHHSPDARIIFSTAHRVDPNRRDLVPAADFLDIETYNARLADFHAAVMTGLDDDQVIIDDKYQFYLDNSPSDFSELPAPFHGNTGAYWHWDGIHFDHNYRQFEAQQTARAILRAVPEPTALGLFLGAGTSLVFLHRRRRESQPHPTDIRLSCRQR